MFRKVFNILALTALMAVSSCVKYQKDYSQTGDTPHVYTDDDVVMFDGVKVRDSVVVRSNVSWEITGNDSPQWLEPTVPSPNNVDATLWLRLEPNTTGASRTATVTVKATDGSDYTSTFVFMQKYSSAPFAVTEGLDEQVRSDGNIWLTRSGGEMPFLFSSNAECTISCDATWCRVVTAADPGTSGDLQLGVGARQALTIVADDNATGDYRIAHITITTTSGATELLSYTIFQVQTDETNIPILTVVNNDQGNIANWTAVDGATDYKLNIYDKGMTLLGTIDCGNALSWDITDFAAATGNTTYVGDLVLNVDANGAISNNFGTNTHFASGGGASAADPFTLSCRRHIDNINKVLSMPGYTYSYYKLAANINYAGAAFTPVGPALGSPFVGDLDGGGYTISGSAKTLTVDDTAYALVGWLANPADGSLTSKVHNLNFDGCSAAFPSTPSANFLGTTGIYAVANCVAYNVGGEVSYINANNPDIRFYQSMGNASNWIHMAAIVGQNGADANFTGVVDHCQTTGGLLGWGLVTAWGGNNNNNNWYTAGIVAMNDPYCTVSYCGNNSTTVNGRYAGAGVVGYNYGTVSHCYNKGNVSGTVIVGGVVGGKSLVSSTTTVPFISTIEYCWNEGFLFVSLGNTQGVWGGVTGGELSTGRSNPAFLRAVNPADPSGKSGLIVRNCYNSGSLTYDASTDVPTSGANRQTGIGSIVGQIYYGSISDCYNTGRLFVNINATNAGGNTSPTRVGGLVGCFNAGNGLPISDVVTMVRCYNAGSLEWQSPFPLFCYIGTIVGLRYNAPNTSISNSFYLNSLQAPATTAAAANSIAGDGKTNGTALDVTASSDVQLADQNTFTGWDFSSTWVMGTGTGVDAYPKLRGTGNN